MVAKLFHNGTMKEESTSSVVEFTTVNDPDFLVDPDTNFFDHPTHPNNQNTSEEEEDDDDKVTIEIPQASIISPAPHVTYPGTSVSIQTFLNVNENDISLFKKLFKFAFLCVQVDDSTGYAGFPLFTDNIRDDNDTAEEEGYDNDVEDDFSLAIIPPFIAELSPGMHTIHIALSHPDTQNIIPGSGNIEIQQSDENERNKFYLSGMENQNASLLMDVNVDQKIQQIPIMEGSDRNLMAQAQYFCAKIGHRGDNECIMKLFDQLSGAWEDQTLLSKKK